MPSNPRLLPFALSVLVLALAGGTAQAVTKISGTVADPAGAGLGNVAVTLVPLDPGQPTQHQTTKKKGQYFFSMVRAGGYRLEAVLDGYRVAKVAIHAKNDERRPSFDFDGALQPGAPMPEFNVGENDTVTYDLVLAPSSAGAGSHGTGVALMETGEIAGLIQRGDMEGARREITRALEVNAGDVRTLYLSGFVEMQAGDLAKARQAADKAAELDPAFPGVHVLRGAILERQGEDEAALAAYKAETERATDPRIQKESWVRYSQLARKLGKNAEAEEALAKVIALDPSSTEAYSQLLETEIREGRLDEALKLLSSAPEDLRKDPRVHFNLGAAFWNKGQTEQAAEAFRSALAADPNFAEAHRQLGYALASLGRNDEAAAELKRYLELQPQAPDAGDVRDILKSLGK